MMNLSKRDNMEEMQEIIKDMSRSKTKIINKDENQERTFEALKIQKKIGRGLKPYFVIWFRDMQGNYKNKDGLYLAVDVAVSNLNKEFLKSIKPGMKFAFKNISKFDKIKAYKFVLVKP